MRVKAIQDHLLCTDGDFGDQTYGTSGIILKDNSSKTQGQVSRWFKVFSVGPTLEEKYSEIQEDKWVYVEYGRWTPGFILEDDRFPDGKKKCWKIDPVGVMAIADEKPKDHLNYKADAIIAERLRR